MVKHRVLIGAAIAASSFALVPAGLAAAATRPRTRPTRRPPRRVVVAPTTVPLPPTGADGADTW